MSLTADLVISSKQILYRNKPLWGKNNTQIRNIDIGSFKVLNERFAKDNNIYFIDIYWLKK